MPVIFSSPSAGLIELLENNIPCFRGPDPNDDNILDTILNTVQQYDKVVGDIEIKPDENQSGNHESRDQDS